MLAIKLCYSNLDFESRLAKNHTTIALKGKKESAALINIKNARYLYCPAKFLQKGTCGCNMASFSFHDGTSSSTRTLLVSKARQSLPISCFLLVQQNNKDRPCLVNRGWVWSFNSDKTRVSASIFCGKAGDLKHSKARLYFYTTCSDFCSIKDGWMN